MRRRPLRAPQEIVEIVVWQRGAGTLSKHGMPMAIRVGARLCVLAGAAGVVDDEDKAGEVLHQ